MFKGVVPCAILRKLVKLMIKLSAPSCHVSQDYFDSQSCKSLPPHPCCQKSCQNCHQNMWGFQGRDRSHHLHFENLGGWRFYTQHARVEGAVACLSRYTTGAAGGSKSRHGRAQFVRQDQGGCKHVQYLEIHNQSPDVDIFDTTTNIDFLPACHGTIHRTTQPTLGLLRECYNHSNWFQL